MKQKLLIGSFIALLGLFIWALVGFARENQKRRAEENNVRALRQDTAEKAAIITLNRKEFEKLFADKEKAVRDAGYNPKNVKEVHFIKYVYRHDTIAQTDTVFKGVESDTYRNTLTWIFDHGCFQNTVTYTEGEAQANDTLTGTIEINRYIVRVKPRWRLFKPRYWWRDNWPTETRVENPCGFQIKENTIFELK